MTTIATDGFVMAGDTQCGGETFHCEVNKIHRADDGAILGCCGQAFDIENFKSWYNEGCTSPLNVSDDFEGLILRRDGTVWCVDEKGRRFQHGLPAAVGSGCRFAYGAMDAGATPEQAVLIASKRDSFTGGRITSECRAVIAPPIVKVA